MANKKRANSVRKEAALKLSFPQGALSFPLF
jgi:hypothetical protein